MKTLKLNVLALIAFLSVGLISCNDDESAPLGIPNPAASNLISQMKVIPDLTILLTALEKTGLTSELSGLTQYTVYAPTNLAFTDYLTANGLSNLDAIPTADLKNLLLNHVINGRKAVDAIDNGYYTTLAKYPGTSISSVVITNGAGAKVNNIAITSTRNVNASNGLLHVTAKVVPFGTVANLIAGNALLSILNGYINATGANAQPDVVAVLTASTSKTVFAPTNTAFTSAEAVNDPPAEPSGFLFGNINPANVNRLLKYHVINGNRQSTTLMNNEIINTFLTLPTQKTVKVSLTGTGISIIDTAMKSAKVTVGNVQASNGTIHIINAVLNPFL